MFISQMFISQLIKYVLEIIIYFFILYIDLKFLFIVLNSYLMFFGNSVMWIRNLDTTVPCQIFVFNVSMYNVIGIPKLNYE